MRHEYGLGACRSCRSRFESRAKIKRSKDEKWPRASVVTQRLVPVCNRRQNYLLIIFTGQQIKAADMLCKLIAKHISASAFLISGMLMMLSGMYLVL